MPKIQARNIDEALYQRIEASAMKHERSLEGEIRIALRDYYTPVEAETAPLSLRERWQQQTGERLQWLLDQLVADGVLDLWQGERPAGIADIVRIARQLGTSPGQLMDLLEGRKEMLPRDGRRTCRTFQCQRGLAAFWYRYPVSRTQDRARLSGFPVAGR